MIQVRRCSTAPPSLSRKTSWRDRDVLDQLCEDFAGKCYLCEGMLPRGWDVEYLHPRAAGGDPYDWNNLYPACHICNIRRLTWGNRGVKIDEKHRSWPEGGMLQPTVDAIQDRLGQSLEIGIGPDESSVTFAALNPTDIAAKNTAEELTHLHNGGRDNARRLRGLLITRWVFVLDLLTKWLMEKAPPEKAMALKRLETTLLPQAPYSALMRQKLKQHLTPELQNKLDL